MPEDLTVLVFGPGAREHVLTDAYERSRRVKKIVVAPGNDFIGFRRKKEVVIDANCDLKDVDSMLAIAEKYRPDLIDVAQDDAIATGVGDMLRQKGFTVFCPSHKASRIEWDKVWSRNFMARHGIPTPEFHTFSSPHLAEKFLDTFYKDRPHRLAFVKAAGLAAGKGALKATSYQEAVGCVMRMSTFGNAGSTFLIEPGLCGHEFSLFAISDGENYYRFKPSRDYKRALDFDEGEQTGGMGTVASLHTLEQREKTLGSPLRDAEQVLLKRVITGMANDGTPYQGILYAGGMFVPSPDDPYDDYPPFCIEYNARWGDPEAQVILPGFTGDYAELVLAACEGKLKDILYDIVPDVDELEDHKYRVCVVGASRGYPGNYSAVRGKRIYGIENALQVNGVTIYSAAIDVVDGRFYANGGRLFSIVGEGKDVAEARERAYHAMALIGVEGNNLHYRTDIGVEEVEIITK